MASQIEAILNWNFPGIYSGDQGFRVKCGGANREGINCNIESHKVLFVSTKLDKCFVNFKYKHLLLYVSQGGKILLDSFLDLWHLNSSSDSGAQ